MVTANRMDVRQQAAAAVRISMVLRDRHQLAVKRAEMLSSTAFVLRAAAEAECDRYRTDRAARQSHRTGMTRELAGFAVEGVVDGQRVAARFAEGMLDCDELLRDRALFLVDLGEELAYADPPRRFVATLDGRPVAVALTLLRACDRVVAFEFDLP
jgi:hypothetical protein